MTKSLGIYPILAVISIFIFSTSTYSMNNQFNKESEWEKIRRIEMSYEYPDWDDQMQELHNQTIKEIEEEEKLKEEKRLQYIVDCQNAYHDPFGFMEDGSNLVHAVFMLNKLYLDQQEKEQKPIFVNTENPSTKTPDASETPSSNNQSAVFK